MYLITWTYNEKYWKNIMMHYPLDTLDSYAHRKLYRETIDGLAPTHLSRIMLMDAPHAINQHLLNPPLQPIKKENTCLFSLITVDLHH